MCLLRDEILRLRHMPLFDRGVPERQNPVREGGQGLTVMASNMTNPLSFFTFFKNAIKLDR